MTAKVGQSLGLGKAAGIGWFWEKRATRARGLGDGSYGRMGRMPCGGGALLELWDEGGAHSAFESALGGFVFGLDLLGRFAFVRVLGRFFERGNRRFWKRLMLLSLFGERCVDVWSALF